MARAEPTRDQGDPFDLARFTSAQEAVYDRALAEIRGGNKRSHWMWCQGTRSVTRLRDTNLYEQDRQPRTIRGDLGLLPTPPGRGHRSLLTAADLLLLLPALCFLASWPHYATFSLPGETEAGSAGEQPTKG